MAPYTIDNRLIRVKGSIVAFSFCVVSIQQQFRQVRQPTTWNDCKFLYLCCGLGTCRISLNRDSPWLQQEKLVDIFLSFSWIVGMAVKRIEGGKGQKRLKYGFAIFIFVVGISTVLVVSVNLSLVGKRSQIQQAGDQHSFEAPKVSTRNSAKERPNMSVNKQNDHEIGDTTSQDGRKFSLDEKVSPRKESELQKSRVSEQQQDPLTSKPHQYHVVFSTSCHVKQDWQSYLFFYQAMIQKQEGNVTRIVSGCTPEQEAQMMKVHEEQITIMSDRFHLHFTPEFGKIPGKSYQETKYWNKPFVSSVRASLDRELVDQTHCDSFPGYATLVGEQAGLSI